MYLRLAALTVVFICSVLAHLNLREYACDDAYIHFRLAQNLISQGELVFNLHEPVLASSAPLWTLAIAIFPLLGISISLGVATLNAILLFLNFFVWRSLFEDKDLSERRNLLAALVISALFYPSASLMEIPLAFLLFGLGLHGWREKKHSAWLWFGLMLFVRIELIVYVLMAAFLELVREKRFPLFGLSLLLLVLGCGATVLYLSFGTVLPHSIVAKSLVYDLSWAERSQRLLYTFFSLSALGDYKGLTLVHIAVTTLLLLFTVLKAPPLKNLRVENIDLLLFFGGLTVALSYFFGGALIFPWYIPLFVLPIVLAIMLVALRSEGWQYQPIAFAFCAPLLLAGFQTFLAGVFYQPSIYPGYPFDARSAVLLETGSTLDSEKVLLAPEIGALGYSFSGKLVDAVGIVSPEALRFHPLPIPEARMNGSIGAVPARMVEWLGPDYVVGYSIFMEELLADSWVQENYAVRRLASLRDSDQRFLGQREFPFGDLLVFELKSEGV